MSGLPEDTPLEAFCQMEGHAWRGGGSCVRCGEKLRCGCGQFVTEARFAHHLDTACPLFLVAADSSPACPADPKEQT